MSYPLDLATDWHTHSSTTDGADSIETMVATAQARGMLALHLTDHVRQDTTWLPEYVAEVNRLRATSSVELICGVEAKMLDVRGQVDLPNDLRGIEQIVVSDHQFPTRNGPVTPDEMARRISSGAVLASDAVGDLVLATARAVFVHERVVVGHLFSVLPKAGISLDEVTPDMLHLLASAFRSAGAQVEVNEKWRTPSKEHIEALCSLGVNMVPSSDAHRAADIAAYTYVSEAATWIVP